MARKVFKYILLGVIAVNLGIFLWVVLSPPPPRVPMPNPNGYDDFVKAGQLARVGTNDFTRLNRDELAVLVATNAEALKLARVGLASESRVPNNYSPGYIDSLEPGYVSFKSLARLFCAEGRLAELESRTNDAAKIYLEGIRFGQNCGRGGIVMSRVVGVACETISMGQLQTVIGGLDGAGCRAAAKSLEAIDSSEDSVKATLDQEQAWARKAFGMKGRIEAFITHNQLKQIQDAMVAKFQANTLRRRQAMLAFAGRAYELEKGKQPQTVAELVPDYLKAVPKDPATGKDLRLAGQ